MDRPGHSHLLHLQQSEPNPFSRPTTPGGSGSHANGIQIGFCGLGAMGYPMVRNLAKWRKQHVSGALPILVWNRTKSKADDIQKELGEDLISVATSLEQVAQECDVIFTNLSTDTVVRDVYGTFVKTCEVCPASSVPYAYPSGCLQESKSSKSKIFVETSTIYPTLAGETIFIHDMLSLTFSAAEIDTLISKIPSASFVMSPVFGPPIAAAAAQLLIVMSGEYRSKKEVAHILHPAVGRKVMDLGGNIEKGVYAIP